MPTGPTKLFNNITSLAKTGASSARPAADYFAGLFGHTTTRGIPQESSSAGFMTRLRRGWQLLASAIGRAGPPPSPDH
jgi:hypothetical protein